MIGIIPSAGKGSRLNMGTKGLVDVKGRHLIEYPLMNMLELGIKRVIIIENENDISNVLQYNWNGIALEYVSQKEKKGIAHAISLTKDLIKDEEVCIILGDIIYYGELKPMKRALHKKKFGEEELDLIVGMKKIELKSQISKSYGLKGGRFYEKPAKPKSFRSLLGLGIYMAKTKAIFEAIEKTQMDEKGEIQITNALNNFERRKHFILDGFYTNINTKEELEEYENRR